MNQDFEQKRPSSEERVEDDEEKNEEPDESELKCGN